MQPDVVTAIRAVESRVCAISDKMADISVDLALVKAHVVSIRRIGKYFCTIVSGVVTGLLLYYATH